VSDAAFADHKREQARRALAMSMTERVQWLDDALELFGDLYGIARWAARRSPSPVTIEPVPGRHCHSYAEYLALEEDANIKLEYLAGDIFARAAATPEHAALTMNAGLALMGVHEAGGRVYSSDLRVRVMATGLAARGLVDASAGRTPASRLPSKRCGC
jgi:hypothetical protein